MQKINTYISLSGGFDSTYFLYKWLEQNRNDNVIVVHHCKLHRSRREVEDLACRQIMEYFNKVGWKNYRYVETEFHRGTMRGLLYDLEVIGFVSGLVLKGQEFRNVKTILGSYCREESPTAVKAIEKGKTFQDVVHSNPNFRMSKYIQYIEYLTKRQFNYVSPWIETTKRSMIQELPEELRNAVWFCRKPANGQPCKKCFNCRRCLPHLNGYEKHWTAINAFRKVGTQVIQPGIHQVVSR